MSETSPPIDGDRLVAVARAWRDEDPDPETRAELDALLGGDGGEPDLAALADRFGARLEFGTAGLRGEMGAGPNRMNRAVVIRATAGLAAWLADRGHAGEPVIVGFDARHRSDRFAADAAAVLAAAGFEVHLADRPLPTPVVAFGVTHLGCCAGVQVTASHNPPRDNGYKVYLGDGAQIVPPVDAEVAARIDAVGPLSGVPRAADGDPRVAPVGDALVDAYVAGALAQAVAPEARELRVVYTPLHGVGRDVLVRVLTEAGFPAPLVVPEQADPDPDFPTVAFPNPEEPGALDLALDLAARRGADVVLANDPDADRLAVAVPPRPGAGGGWRPLSGDEIGVLLADWLLEHGSGPDRLVVTTIVSSSMLARLAAARGVAHAETLTGFKWIARAARERPDLRFVYGYEEALGSCVGTLVRDKDGITAALAFAELAAAEKRRGRTVHDRLDDLARELGVHATGQRSVRVEGLDGRARMRAAIDALADDPPRELAGVPVTEVEDLRPGGRLPPTDAVVVRGEGVRLIVRPSGTEPKIKCYAEAVVTVAGGAPEDLAAARARGAAMVEAILDQAVALVG
ncbi:MAG TPA: phospho-sugar mutase [Acidimicrobiales bacterium]|nr:phospho-sugar mutase [Acidimicrobiales bacterium]